MGTIGAEEARRQALDQVVEEEINEEKNENQTMTLAPAVLEELL